MTNPVVVERRQHPRPARRLTDTDADQYNILRAVQDEMLELGHRIQRMEALLQKMEGMLQAWNLASGIAFLLKWLAITGAAAVAIWAQLGGRGK